MVNIFLRLKKNLCFLIGLVAVIFFIIGANPSQATITSHFVTGAYTGSTSPGYFNNASLNNVYIDPSSTNWIAWHDNATPDVVGGTEYVGDYWNWLGVDDWLYVTITALGGATTGQTLMDKNNAFGGYEGTQAVFYGTAADAPDVTRAFGSTWPPPMTTINESGGFNDFFNANGATTYSFDFQFYNKYSGSSYNPDFYLLVDTNSSTVPEPGTMILLGTSLLGLFGAARRKSRKN